MEFIKRLIALIAAILFIPNTINTLLQFRGYYKKMKIFKLQKDNQHPFTKPIYTSIAVSVVLFALFYVLGGFGFVHSFLYPPKPKTVTKIVKIHDTIKVTIHDTLHVKDGKSFNNHIKKVGTLNQY